MKLKSFVQGKWTAGTGKGKKLYHAVTGENIAEVTSEGLDFKSILAYARNIGGPKLRGMTFHERGRMLKAMALYLMDKKEVFYKLSPATGATKIDSWIDIEGGISTFFTYATKGRREMPDETFYVEGNLEQLSKNGTFIGRHVCVPLEGAAIHINAFNFPCWGMLEKLAPTFLAGMPAIVKPASITSYLTRLMVEEMIKSGILPDGALQLICGGVGDLLDHLDCQDVVTFTGSASTGRKLKENPVIVENSTRFNMEADSLNFSMLGPDAAPDTEEFNLFIKEVAKEMTVKAGQKCTAIRRTIVPDKYVGEVNDALKKRLSGIAVGDPSKEGVRMGPLASREQVDEVAGRVEALKSAGELVYGDPEDFEIVGGSKEKGAFFPPILFYCDKPFKKREPHDIEAFGPVNTVMPYKTVDEAIELAKLGRGSLVGSLFTADNNVAREVVFGTAPYHGRLMVINRDCAKESTGHGSPLPHLVHGGPGRAGGGEELGGIRSVLHYMQRTALQGSPTTLSHICNEWMKGGERKEDIVHPFRKYFDDLQIGDSLTTHRRTVTEADIVNFAGVSGDFFYAHMDVTSLEGSIFKRRVAHGYFIISAAAGLFVDPKKGPVLANYGIDDLRFTKPVYVGDTFYVKLTCKEKTKKEKREDEVLQGIVKWDVEVLNQEHETVAQATILTLVQRKDISDTDSR